MTITVQVSATASAAGTRESGACNGSENFCNNASVSSDEVDSDTKDNAADEPIDVTAFVAFRARAFGDFSAATIPQMSTLVYIGNDVAGLTAAWRGKPGNWRLFQTDY